jgi:hypothetical protein
VGGDARAHSPGAQNSYFLNAFEHEDNIIMQAGRSRLAGTIAGGNSERRELSKFAAKKTNARRSGCGGEDGNDARSIKLNRV